MGLIAGIAAWVAFAGAAIMLVFVVAGFVHLRHTKA
jgi:L-asparagine transporter-like permease